MGDCRFQVGIESSWTRLWHRPFDLEEKRGVSLGFIVKSYKFHSREPKLLALFLQSCRFCSGARAHLCEVPGHHIVGTRVDGAIASVCTDTGPQVLNESLGPWYPFLPRTFALRLLKSALQLFKSMRSQSILNNCMPCSSRVSKSGK